MPDFFSLLVEVFGTSPLPSVVVSVDFSRAVINDAMSKVTGITAPADATVAILKRIFPKDREIEDLLGEPGNAAAFQSPVTGHVHIACDNGTLMSTEVFVTQYMFNGDSAIALQVSCDDFCFTDIKRLLEQETVFRTLFENSNDYFYITGLDSRIIEINPAAKRLLGIVGKDIRGSDFADYVLESDHEKFHGRIKKLMRPGQREVPMEYAIKRSDGKVVFVETNSVVVKKNDEPFALVGIARDVTRRRRTELELHKTVERLKGLESIITRSPAVVFLWRCDEGWPVEFVTDNVSQFGYSAEGFLSGEISWPGVTHPDDLLRLEKEVADYTKNGVREFYQEYRLTTASGESRWVGDHTCAILDSSGQLTHYQGIILDITQQKQAEDTRHRLIKNMNFLAESAMELVQIVPEDNMYEAIGRQLSVLLDSYVIAVSSFENSTGILRNRALLGIEPIYNKLVGVLGRHPKGMTFHLSKKEMAPLLRGKLTRIKGGLSAMMFGTIPKFVCQTIETMFRIKDMYGIGFISKGNLFGTMVIVGFQDSTELDMEFVETYCSQASIALQRWLAEKAFRDSETKYQTLADNINDIIYSLDRYGTLSHIGPQIDRYGFEPGDVVGRHYIDFIVEDDKDQVAKIYRDALETGNGSARFRIRNPKGDVFWMEGNGTSIIADDGSAIGVTGVLRDITQRKAAEDALMSSEIELYRQKTELERKNIALREIISQVEVEKNIIRDDVMTNVKEIILPMLEKVKLSDPENRYIDLLRHLLENLTSAYGNKISDSRHSLTGRELEICTMIEGGLSNKEIAALLGLSARTVENHRKNIRRKLNIRNKKVNLAAFLRNL